MDPSTNATYPCSFTMRRSCLRAISSNTISILHDGCSAENSHDAHGGFDFAPPRGLMPQRMGCQFGLPSSSGVRRTSAILPRAPVLEKRDLERLALAAWRTS